MQQTLPPGTVLQPQINVKCEGTAFEIGRAQGVALRERIGDARDTLAVLEAFRSRKPFWMPYGLYLHLAERRASSFLRKALAGDELSRQRMQGLSEGSGFSLNSLSLLNSLEPVLSTLGPVTDVPPLAGCSSIAVRGSRSASGNAAIARNFDYLKLVQPFCILREERPRDGYASLIFTLAPLVGALDGVNERGLCITYNYLFTADEGEPAPILSMRIAEALATCATVDEAAEWFAARPRVGTAALMLADAEGGIASLEVANTRVQVRKPNEGDDFIYHTNQCLTPEIRALQIPQGSVYSRKAPGPLQGSRPLQSPELRDLRIEELINTSQPMDADSLHQIMSDHGADGEPNADTVCMHSNYWQTTACIQLFPVERRIRVAYNSACEAEFTDFQLA